MKQGNNPISEHNYSSLANTMHITAKTLRSWMDRNPRLKILREKIGGRKRLTNYEVKTIYNELDFTSDEVKN